MTKQEDILHWANKSIKDQSSWKELPTEWSEEERARVRLHTVTSLMNKEELAGKIVRNGVINKASGRNCEQMIGELTVPLGVAGPLLFQGMNKKKYSVFVPLATTEGALVASVQRGVKATKLSGGIKTFHEHVGITRAPVLTVNSLSEGNKIKKWIKDHFDKLKRVAKKSSDHITLLEISSTQVGRNLFLRMRFDTSDAMGMNMATFATEEIVQVITQSVGGTLCALSGNACVDKKPSWTNVLLGRGMIASAEVMIPRDVVQSVLKTTPEKIIEVVMRKDYIGSAISGSMGFNAHYANMIAAIYLATGQDMAHVVEGSLGVTTAELIGENLYFSVYLPNVVVGAVGGGTHLPVQHAVLELMGLYSGKQNDKSMLTDIISATVLCGELSLTAALASSDLACAHRRLGRKHTT